MNSPQGELEIQKNTEPYRRSTWKGTGHRKDGARAYNYREFISVDGEGTAVNEPVRHHIGNAPPIFQYPGEKRMFSEYTPEPQPYVLLANSKGERIVNREGLSTRDCLEFLLETKQRHPDSILVGFGLNYDINQILKDLSEHKRERLRDKNRCRFGRYFIKWMPRKTFYCKDRRTGRSVMLYDTIGYFQSTFLLVCQKYLPKDKRLQLIEAGKSARQAFTWEELETFIIPYNNAEMDMHVSIMNLLRDDLHAIGIDTNEWYGPGAIANKFFKNWDIPIDRKVPEEVLDASQFAYFGGRFEHFRMGRFPATVYEYDIHSAYPAAATLLPNLQRGYWSFVSSFQPGSFGVWHIDFRAPDGDWTESNRPGPLPCRARDGRISYPTEVTGWYWTPEAALVSDYVIEGWVFVEDDASDRPFERLKELYDQRRIYKSEGNPAERAIKLVLNSVYGKLAQTVGFKDDEPPRWHQLEYAGFITSYTRSMIYNAIQLAPDCIISAETDAVFSTVPLDLPLTDELGDWEEEIFDEITYLQSGFYYAMQDDEVKCRFRGMDRDRNTNQPVGLPYEEVIAQLGQYKKTLRAITTRFVGMGMALSMPKSVWRSWETKPHAIKLYQQTMAQKRCHHTDLCEQCEANVPMSEALHNLVIGGESGESHARPLPWRKPEGPQEAFAIDWTEHQEIYGVNIEPWQA